MDRVFEFLRHNPLIAVLLVGWVLSAIGGAITKAKKQLPRRGPDRLPQQRPEPATSQRHQAPATRPQPAAQRQQPTASQRQLPQSADEVAREMRRILGLEPAPSRPRTEPPKPLRPVAPDALRRRNVAEPERAPQPFTPSTLGTVASRVQPHVGEEFTRRRAPTSGAVGAAHLGELGGRHPALRQTSRPTTRLVDLRNLTRAIVLKEILGPPKALE